MLQISLAVYLVTIHIQQERRICACPCITPHSLSLNSTTIVRPRACRELWSPSRLMSCQPAGSHSYRVPYYIAHRQSETERTYQIQEHDGPTRLPAYSPLLTPVGLKHPVSSPNARLERSMSGKNAKGSFCILIIRLLTSRHS